MSETETDTEAARIKSIDELQAEQERQGGMLQAILDKLGGAESKARDAAGQHTEDRLNRPSNVAEEIRAQLAERDKAEQAKASERESAEWRKGVDEKLSGMAEKVPEAPLRRVEKIMGWR